MQRNSSHAIYSHVMSADSRAAASVMYEP